MTETVLETERLLLQKPTIDDAEFYYQLLREPLFKQHIADLGIESVEDAKNFIEKYLIGHHANFGFGMLTTRLKADNTAIGFCGAIKREYLEWPDMGYALLPEFFGKGYATEGAKVVLDHCHNQLGMDKVVAYTTLENAESMHVLEKIGLKRDKLINIPDGERMLFTSCRDES